MSMYSPPPENNMSDADFKTISDIAYKEAGLVFPAEKASLVRSRINRRLRDLKMTKFSDYASFVSSENGLGERRKMISSLTTNVSNFFRESHHFDALKSDVLPDLLSKAHMGGRVRVWSAGCSTGQEPYSLAMALLDMEPDVGQYDIKILATDIDVNVINTAKCGQYDSREAKDICDKYLEKFTTPTNAGRREGFQINDAVQKIITFQELNLLKPWPISGKFDVIFCRNVVIYFDDVTQQKLWPRFESATTDGGWLFVGHSERVSEASNTRYIPSGPTTYHLPLL